MELTAEQLKKMAPYATDANIQKYLPLLNNTFDKYQINTKLRLAHFMAQVLHESGSLRFHEEIASGDAYEDRRDLGNYMKGDGRKFKGRGLIQLTGRANYEAYGKYLGMRLQDRPELVGTDYAADVAGWFWSVHNNLNPLADKDDIRAIIKHINGGYNGFNERLSFLIRAKETLAV